MKVLSKKGNEVVEAAIVIPIFILMIVTLIGLGIFYFNSFTTQCRIQREIVDEIKEVKLPVKKVEKSGETSDFINGISGKSVYIRYSQYGYAIDETMMLRTGELIEVLK